MAVDIIRESFVREGLESVINTLMLPGKFGKGQKLALPVSPTNTRNGG